jgi:hypothetical protein
MAGIGGGPAALAGEGQQPILHLLDLDHAHPGGAALVRVGLRGVVAGP